MVGSSTTHKSVILTARYLDSLQAIEIPYRVPDQRCAGLAVRVAPSGGRTWDLAYRIARTGKVRRISLGRVEDVSLEVARLRAYQLTSAARAGRDLLEDEKRAEEEAEQRLTVRQLVDVYCRRRVEGRLRTGLEIRRRLLRSLDSLIERHASDLRRRDIRPLFDAVAESGTVREAEKRRQTVGAMFRWALSQDLVEIDPTAGLTAYDPGTTRDRVLADSEISAFWNWTVSGVMSGEASCILRLQLLTGARCGEVSGITAEEVDVENWLWTLPAARSKNKRQRVTPIVGLAREIIQARIDSAGSGPLFLTELGTTFRSVNVGHCLWVRRHRLPIAKFTTHDLRRTVATALVEMGFPLDTVAAVIGHDAGRKETRTLVRHYVRTEQIQRKTQVLAAWDAKVDSLVFGGSDVVSPLRALSVLA